MCVIAKKLPHFPIPSESPLAILPQFHLHSPCCNIFYKSFCSSLSVWDYCWPSACSLRELITVYVFVRVIAEVRLHAKIITTRGLLLAPTAFWGSPVFRPMSHVSQRMSIGSDRPWTATSNYPNDVAVDNMPSCSLTCTIDSNMLLSLMIRCVPSQHYYAAVPRSRCPLRHEHATIMMTTAALLVDMSVCLSRRGS